MNKVKHAEGVQKGKEKLITLEVPIMQSDPMNFKLYNKKNTDTYV